MTRHPIVTVALTLFLATPALAQVQSAGQQACATGVEKSFAKLVKTTGKDVSACLKSIAKSQASAGSCFGKDLKGKVAKSQATVESSYALSCVGNRPDFGFGGAGAALSAAQETDDALLATLFGVERLVGAYHPERVYLFGSRARGGAGVDSNYDLLLVVPDDADPARRRSRLAYQVLRGTGVAADVLVWPRREFDGRLHLRASFPATVVREGQLLHAVTSPPVAGRYARLACPGCRGPQGRRSRLQGSTAAPDRHCASRSAGGREDVEGPRHQDHRRPGGRAP